MNILEGREKLKETSTEFGEQLSEGEQIQKEGEETDRIVASIDTSGLDSDTIEAARKTESDLSGAYTEKISDLRKRFDIGVAYLGFPTRNRLWRYAKISRKLILSYIVVFS